MHEHTQIYLISAIALLFFGALASCFETAVTACSRARTHRLADNGNKKAKILQQLLLQREKVVGTMILINNLVSILSSVLTTSVLIAFFGEIGLFYATIAMTILTVIFCDIGPKSLALKIPNQIALFFAPLIKFLVVTCFPVIHFVQKFVDFVIGFFFTSKKKSFHAELEEIRETVDLKHKEGGIVKYDRDMLEGVLDLSDTEISEIMVHRKDISSINIDLKAEEVIKQALDSSYTRVGLWQGNKENIVAVLNVRKLLKALYLHKGDLTNFNIKTITKAPWFVPATNSLKTQLFAFRKHQRKFAFVVDEYGSLLGLITLEDILAEIVGDIREKDRQEDLNITKVSHGTYKISAKTLIRDVNKELNWDIEESEHAYNIAGLIISKIDRIPEEKESFVIDGYSFQILKKNGNDLVFVKVKKLTKSLPSS